MTFSLIVDILGCIRLSLESDISFRVNTSLKNQCIHLLVNFSKDISLKNLTLNQKNGRYHVLYCNYFSRNKNNEADSLLPDKFTSI